MHVSNYHFNIAGIWTSIYFGTEDQISYLKNQSAYLDLVLFGSLYIMAIYHLFLFSMRKENKSTLYFGLLCFLFSLRTLLGGEILFFSLFPSADWFIVLKILYLLFPFLSILFSLFIYSLYTLDYPKILLNYTIYSSLLYIIIIIITDTPVYSYLLLNLFLITSFLTIFFNFYVLIRAIYNKREGSLIFIFGFIILILSLVNDVLYDAGIIKSRYLLSVGFFILILCQATVLALKFTFAFFKAENLSAELFQTNMALGQLVAGVAHEINNPIGAVQASAERIQAELEIGTKEFPEYFGNLKENEVHIFTELLDHALANKVVLTTKEERNRKKIIKQSLESLDFSSSENRSLALDYLSNLGITDGLEPYFNSLKEDSFLKTIYIVDRFVSQDKSLRNIYISVEKASKVVFSMRKFLNANIKTEKKIISIREEIEKVIKVYDNYINGFIAVSFEANSDVNFLCHTEEMTQVWRNIIFNAIQAMYSTEKYLKISIVSDQDSDISGKKMVTIKFQDTGMGMTPETKEKIYTPFFTTKPTGEGIGLGLFISRKIVEEHGGEISFTSEVGNTEFVIRFAI